MCFLNPLIISLNSRRQRNLQHNMMMMSLYILQAPFGLASGTIREFARYARLATISSIRCRYADVTAALCASRRPI